jgi:serine/threonine protein kinase
MDAETAAVFHGLRGYLGKVVAGKYRLDRLVGIGGMGAVFRAHQLGANVDVAVKILRPDLVRQPEITARFEREARLSSRLDHVNCVRVLDFGAAPDGTRFIVMQLLEGRELSAFAGTPLSVQHAGAIAVQILRGLDHAHKRGVTHRDVKPSNILLGRDGEGALSVKICDFGIAKVARRGGDAFTTRIGLIFGTPAYMSPEQAMGVEADHRTDIYSTGVILYEMLAGRPPFDSDDPVSLAQMHLSTPPPALPASIPPLIAAVVARMLTKKRSDRFQTAAEAAERLDTALRMIGTNAEPPKIDAPPPETRRARGAAQPSVAEGGMSDSLAAFDEALKKVLQSATPVAEEHLTGDLHGERKPAGGIDMDNLELEDVDPSRYRR